MLRRKWLLALITGTALGVGAFWYYSKSNINHEQEAFAAFKNGSYDQALSHLNEIQKIDSNIDRLYKSYLYRAQNNSYHHREELQSAFSQLEQAGFDKNAKLSWEVALNFLLDDFISKNTEQLNCDMKLLEKLPLIPEALAWQQLFQSILHFQQGNPTKSIECLEKCIQPIAYLSPWMEVAFKPYFDSIWKQLLLAECEIELGKTIQARQILQPICNTSNPLKEKAFWLMGFSYLKESQSKPQPLKLPFFELAFEYLKKTPLNSNEYKIQREQVVLAFYQQAIIELKAQNWEAFALFSKGLSLWNANSQINELSDDILNLGFDCVSSHDTELFLNGYSQIKDTYEKSMLANLNKRFENALSSSDFNAVLINWKLANLLNLAPTDTISFVQAAIEKNIREQIRVIDSKQSLQEKETAYEMACLWLKTAKIIWSDPKETSALSLRLLNFLEPIMLKENTQTLGIALLKNIFELPSEKDAVVIKKIWKDNFEKLFSNAANLQNFKKMKVLQELAKSLSLPLPCPNPQQLINLLADTQYLIDQGRLEDAKTQLDWILVNSPKHQKALGLLGITSYKLNDFETSIYCFENIDKLSTNQLEILTLAYIGAHKYDPAMKIVENLKNFDLFKEATLLKVIDAGIESSHWNTAFELCNH